MRCVTRPSGVDGGSGDDALRPAPPWDRHSATAPPTARSVSVTPSATGRADAGCRLTGGRRIEPFIVRVGGGRESMVSTARGGVGGAGLGPCR